MKKIDVYILKNFLLTFLFILWVIMSIAVVFDVSEKVEDFVRSEATFGQVVLDYYVNFVVFYSNLFSSLLIFIAVIFFTAKMAGRSEIIAILSSGVSYNRLLVPYLIGATILTVFSLYANHTWVPHANRARLDFENEYLKRPYRLTEKHIHRHLPDSSYLYMESYNNHRNVGYKLSLEKWEGVALKEKTTAKVVLWDSTANQWQLRDYVIRTFNNGEEQLTVGAKMDTIFPLSPEEFQLRLGNVDAMTTRELDAFISEKRRAGDSNIPYYLVLRHQRTSYPFATYVLTLIGVSIASRKTRGGLGLNLVIGILICVTYILVMKVATVYALNAGLDPLIAVWLPNLLFGIGAVGLYSKAQK